MFSRRSLLQGALGACFLGPAALAAHAEQPRLMVVLLRGGLDGLAAVPAPGDPYYTTSRGSIALPEREIVPLDGIFGLHPGLRRLAPLYKKKEMAVVHAVSTPGGARSHFDAQDVLDNGTGTPGHRTGWLNRCATGGESIALGRQVPLMLRGPRSIQSCDPTRQLKSGEKLIEAAGHLYAHDPELLRALEGGLSAVRRLEQSRQGRRAGKSFSQDNARTVGRLLASDTLNIGVIEVSGWDTHVNQRKGLERRLTQLSEGLLGLQEGLGLAWSNTVVMVVSEFGRTVRGNGTRGTDHGSAGMILLLGGAVRGGRVLGRWPGLAKEQLFEGRDLMPTTDARSVFKGLVVDHLGIEARLAESVVFPDSASAPLLSGLFRS